MVDVFIAGLVIMIASLVGVIFLRAAAANWVLKNMQILVTLAAGIFLATALNLAGEAFELAPSLAAAAGSIIGGFLLFLALDNAIPESHHHHDPDNDCNQEHSKSTAMRMMIGDGIHNTADGIILSAAFLINIHLGIITTVSIFVHELVQEIGEFFVLRHAGYTVTQALVRNFVISGTILIGILIGWFLGESFVTLTILIGIASGGFLYIVVADLVPFHLFMKREKGFMQHALALLLGLALIFSLNALVPHDIEVDVAENIG